MISVAIDGPSGAGKSTIARAVSEELRFLYIDTGALYRAIGLFVLRRGKDAKNEADVTGCLSELALSLRHVDGGQRVFLGDEDVSDAIRTPEISMAASGVAAIPAVRAFLLDVQRSIARENNVIMDGRDIATAVLPNAQVKIFLTASAADRARRRYEELLARGEKVTYEDVLRDVETRDYNDSHRAASPLRQAPDALLVDTTGFALEQAIRTVKEQIVRQLAKEA